MSFTTLIFPFLFLPLSFLLYLVIPGRTVKNVVLLICSLLFFAWGSPVCLLILAASLVFNYFTARELEGCLAEGRDRRARFVLITGVAVDLLLLAFYKYFGFVLDNLNGIFGLHLQTPELPIPIGISFFTFSVLSFLFDVYRGKVERTGSFLDFSLYVSFFPKLVSGPIVQYHEMLPQLHDHPVSRPLVSNGVRRFLIGMAKKLLIADTLGRSFYALTALPGGSVSVLSAWLGAILYTLMLYFDFSGYSDMAIGLAELFGFRVNKNFDYPYQSGSITEFWRRWHISLGAWFRDYVYIPLGGSREGTGKTVRNLLIVWALTGIWHGANWTFLFWGLYYGGLLLLEKFVLKSFFDKLPHVVRRLLTLLLVVIGWVFFFSPDLGFAFRWLGQMFGIGAAGFAGGTFGYFFGGCWLVLLLALVGSSPIPANIGNNLLKNRSLATRIVSVAFFALLLFFCIAGMVSSTYTSFLYFQF